MRLLGSQSFVLNSDGTVFFPLKLSKGEGKEKVQGIRVLELLFDCHLKGLVGAVVSWIVKA